jgi:hypothetical protein
MDRRDAGRVETPGRRMDRMGWIGAGRPRVVQTRLKAKRDSMNASMDGFRNQELPQNVCASRREMYM